MSALSYVVISPARNEAQFIGLTLESMIAQTVKPLRWVIVSDGSTDGTDELVLKYAAQHPWIQLVRMPERRERNFAGKIFAFNAGFAQVKDLKFDVMASLDADISFDPEYFSFLLEKLAGDRTLGLVGTPFKDGPNGIYDYRFVNIEHVSGACQVFRRECYEQIGGYVPVKGGGVDFVAVTTARMRGWKTRTYTEKTCLHHRVMGTAQHGTLKMKYRTGVKDYALGNHPLWELSRTFYQMTNPPFFIGSVMMASGYVWSMLTRAQRPVSDELVAFCRREQMARLKRFFTGNKASSQSQIAASS